MSFPEINRDERGHDFYPSDAERVVIPDLYATEDVALDNTVVHAHYAVRGGVGEWWVMELEHDSDTSMLAFGFADLGHREAGYFDLVALESLRIEYPDRPVIIVERDLHWTPRRWSEVRS